MSRSRPLAGRDDTPDEAPPVAVLVPGVLSTALTGVHAMAAAVARAAAPAAADAVVNAARNAAPGDRVNEGVPAARLALIAARSSVIETRPPAMATEPERGQVKVLVPGGIISPVFGGAKLSARACGPLDDITALGSQQRRSPAMPRPRTRLAHRRLSWPAAARRGPCRRGAHGPGAAVGAAPMFPALMTAIALTQMLSGCHPSRAGTASRRQPGRPGHRIVLLPDQRHRRSGSDSAGRAERATDAPADNRTHCNNDLASDADVGS